MFDSSYMFPVAFALAWVGVTWIRAHYGIQGPFGRHNWHNNPKNMNVPPMFQKMMEKGLEERDAEMQALKERIEVLERIVTDSHKSNRLADEIEKLREKNL